MLQGRSSLDSSNVDFRSARGALQDELAGKLVFDDPGVFERLALDRVSSQFVTSCADAFKTDQKLISARRELEGITDVATRMRIEELLQVDEEAQFSWGLKMREIKRKVTGVEMYKPLTFIFQHVQNFEDSFNPRLLFESTVLKSDSSIWGLPKSSPDFVIVENPGLSSIPSASGQKHVLWHGTLGFCELFSVGLLIFGSEFCIAIFDHSRVTFSPIHDMWDDIEMFIRVIRSLTCHLSSVELGQDPTVTTLPDQQYDLWRAQMTELRREAPKDFPTFMMRGHSRYIVGPPIWNSVSLFGRATSVWLVREKGTGPVFVQQNTWRSSSTIFEAMTYCSIDGHHPALPKLDEDESVLFPAQRRYITTRNLRGTSPDGNDNIEGGIVLQRLLLEGHGRPLWEYRSEKELLQGIRAALSAHQFLCEQGILHRDINAGNIMLSAQNPPDVGVEGFLMDLDFARVDRSFFDRDTTRNITVPPVSVSGGGAPALTVRPEAVCGPDVACGVAMKGTAQFMALKILEAIVIGTPVEHGPQHDIESFVYILAFSRTRKVLESQALGEGVRKRLRSYFSSHFGRRSVDDIFVSRRGQEPLTAYIFFPLLFSEPMNELLRGLESWLRQSNLPPECNPISLTHTYLLAQLDKAIAKMVWDTPA